MTHIDQIKVKKRDGTFEPINLDKIHKVITWAAKGLDNVSVSQVELKSHIQFYDGIATRDIHETIIKAAADLISAETPDYQYLAARLAIFHLRKIAYGDYEPPHLYDHVARLTEIGKYDKHILADYDRAEFDELNAYIDHERDMNLAYAAVEQMMGKYLVQDRVTKKVYESPSFCTFWLACAYLPAIIKRCDWTTSSVFMTLHPTSTSHCLPPSCQACVPPPVSLAHAYSSNVATT